MIQTRNPYSWINPLVIPEKEKEKNFVLKQKEAPYISVSPAKETRDERDSRVRKAYSERTSNPSESTYKSTYEPTNTTTTREKADSGSMFSRLNKSPFRKDAPKPFFFEESETKKTSVFPIRGDIKTEKDFSVFMDGFNDEELKKSENEYLRKLASTEQELKEPSPYLHKAEKIDEKNISNPYWGQTDALKNRASLMQDEKNELVRDYNAYLSDTKKQERVAELDRDIAKYTGYISLSEKGKNISGNDLFDTKRNISENLAEKYRISAESSNVLPDSSKNSRELYKKEWEKYPREGKYQKTLDGLSTALTAASFIPGIDTFTNLAQVPVDLLRGDYLGALLDLVGVLPVIGEVADGAKSARAINKFADSAKVIDKASGIELIPTQRLNLSKKRVYAVIRRY